NDSGGGAHPEDHVARQILSALQEAVIAMDTQGRIVFWNAFAEALYGWSADEVLGANLGDVLTPTERYEAQQIADQLKLGEGWIGEWAVQHRDGHEVRVWV